MIRPQVGSHRAARACPSVLGVHQHRVHYCVHYCALRTAYCVSMRVGRWFVLLSAVCCLLAAGCWGRDKTCRYARTPIVGLGPAFSPRCLHPWASVPTILLSPPTVFASLTGRAPGCRQVGAGVPGLHATSDKQQARQVVPRGGDRERRAGRKRQRHEHPGTSGIGRLEYGALAWAAGGKNRDKMCPLRNSPRA